MDDDEKFAIKMGCGSCLGILVVFLLCLAAFTYASILVIDAIQS